MDPILWYLFPKSLGYGYARFNVEKQVIEHQRADGTWGLFDAGAVKPLVRAKDAMNGNVSAVNLTDVPEGAAILIYGLDSLGKPTGSAIGFAAPPVFGTGQGGVTGSNNVIVNFPAAPTQA